MANGFIAICEEQGWACAYCGCAIHRCDHGPNGTRGCADAATRDHVVPTSLGGLSHLDNIVAACHDCNQTKGDETWEVGTRPVPKIPRGRQPMTATVAERIRCGNLGCPECAALGEYHRRVHLRPTR